MQLEGQGEAAGGGREEGVPCLPPTVEVLDGWVAEGGSNPRLHAAWWCSRV